MYEEESNTSLTVLRGLEHPSKNGSDWNNPDPEDERFKILMRLVEPESVDALADEVRQMS
jgi:hypothetical protein